MLMIPGPSRAAGGVDAGQIVVLVVVVTGAVEGEAPAAGRAAVAQPAQRQDLTVGKLAVDVGELSAE